jgi:hypothetical protein
MSDFACSSGSLGKAGEARRGVMRSKEGRK